jgi:hypothetical protein
MRRLALPSTLATLSTLSALATSALATSPRPEVPRSTLAPKLGDLLRTSSYRPSPLVHEALAREGLTYGEEAPVFMPPMRAVGAAFRVVGDVAILEGDAETVTDFGNGQFGLRYDNGRQDPMTITDRFIAQFGDEYDFIAVWTSFWDYGADGLAYYVPIVQNTQGLGDDRYDQSRWWGSSGRLQGFLNMKAIEVYGNIRNANNYVYPVIGQEFSHRWLAQMKFARATGAVSDAILGRDDAHWSSLLQADGSVQDGNTWRDNGDGTFTVTENMARYSPLDLYGMGIFGPDEVPPFYLIENARYRNSSVNGLATFPVGAKVSGTRTDITITDIIAANGPRKPSAENQQKDFRMAFILVTAPGESAEDVADQIAAIETFRGIWEAKYREWTYGRSTICTRATAACDRPAFKVTGQSAREVEGDGDEMPEPGEKLSISLAIENVGGGAATESRVHVVLPDGVDLSVGETPVMFGDLAAGERIELPDVFTVTLGEDAPCGSDITLPIEVATGDYLATSSVTFPLGYLFLFNDDFSTDRGWQVNARGEDTASAGAWERSVPSGVNAGQVGFDFQTQPASDFNGGGKAFVTGASRGDGLGGNDVDGGSTSVTSPPIALGEAVDPSFSYRSWHTALDFNSQPNSVLADDNDGLIVELSADDGATWVALENDTSNDETWAQKTYRVLDLLPAVPATMRLRFTARDAEPQSLSEAAIDDVRVWDLQPSCYEPLVEPEPTDPTQPGTTDPGTTPTDTPGGDGDGLGTDPSDGGVQPVLGRTSRGGCHGGGGDLAVGLALGFLVGLIVRWARANR